MYPPEWKISFEDTIAYMNVNISSPTDKFVDITRFLGKPAADKPNWTKNFILR